MTKEVLIIPIAGFNPSKTPIRPELSTNGLSELIINPFQKPTTDGPDTVRGVENFLKTVLEASRKPSVLSDRSVLEAGLDRVGYRRERASVAEVQTILSVITKERRPGITKKRRPSGSRSSRTGRSSWSRGASSRSSRERCHKCGQKQTSGVLNPNHECLNNRQIKI